VRECAVLAVKQESELTALKAFVVLNDKAAASDATTRSLQDYVKGRLLPYKYPRLVTYLDDLPKTGTGKIDRQALLQDSAQ
jgi:acetyl-CoA synthetase